MLNNYLKIALRIMMNQRGFSLINIAGLTISMACTLLLVLYIQDELSYDQYHPDAHRIFRIASKGKLQGAEFNTAETGPKLARGIQTQLPEIESVLRVANWPTFPVSYKGNSFTEPHLLLADSNLFSFFNFKLVQGNPREALRAKASIVISESAAKRYFQITDNQYQGIIGETILLAQGYTAKITGVVEDAPANSHFHFTLILSLSSWEELETMGWVQGKVKTYVKARQELSTSTLDKQLERFVQNEIAQELKTIYATDLTEFVKKGNYVKLFSQPLGSIHLQSHLNNEIEANNDIQYIYLFAAVAIFITVLACINFVNLSTARSASRAKEVGVRKTIGARNRKLVFQFLLESYLYTIIAVIFSIILIWMAILPFNLIAGKSLSMRDLLEPYFIGGILLFIFWVGLFAGSYPAFFLTYFSPAQILKGSLRSGVTSHKIRNVLVGFQFTISISLIIATAVVYQQLRYMQKRQIGFSNENIINLLHTANLKENALKFKTEILKQPGIRSASFANRIPPNVDWTGIFRYGEQKKEYLMAIYEMDADHLKTMNYHLVQGAFFSGTAADTTSVIINETAARLLNIKNLDNQPILEVTNHAGGFSQRKIIGIIQDFNFRSLKMTISPLVVMPGRVPNWEMAIRIDDKNMGETLEQLEAVWHQYALGAPFEYSFVDNNYQLSYTNEERIGEVFLLFTMLAILIASLGLFGLTIYTTEQRTKEIGIRKTLGATHREVFIMIGKDFVALVIIALLIAAPLTWIGMEQWLKQYPYRINIPLQTVVLSGVLSLLITLITISAQTFKAANTNPVKSLRNE